MRLPKNLRESSVIEQRGMCAGGKKPPARSIKQVFKIFIEDFENRTAWQKTF